MKFDKVFGIICIAFGLAVVGFAIGELLLRVLIALLGLFIVNYGMRMLGMPPLHITAMRIWSSSYYF